MKLYGVGISGSKATGSEYCSYSTEAHIVENGSECLNNSSNSRLCVAQKALTSMLHMYMYYINHSLRWGSFSCSHSRGWRCNRWLSSGYGSKLGYCYII